MKITLAMTSRNIEATSPEPDRTFTLSYGVASEKMKMNMIRAE